MTNTLTPYQQISYQDNGYVAKDIRERHEPGFYMWASNFFVKEPHTDHMVGWHHGAYCWPVGTPPTEKFSRTNFKAVSLEKAGRG